MFCWTKLNTQFFVIPTRYTVFLQNNYKIALTFAIFLVN